MELPRPFIYPNAGLVRLHGPQGYLDYGGFKPWLRDEFSFRCVYCLEREEWAPDRADSFSIEHLEPQSQAPDLVNNYDNLLYACTRCNSFRRSEALPLNPIEDIFGHHIQINDNGQAEALTTQGEKFIDLFLLNESPALDNRQRYLNILKAKSMAPENSLIHQIFFAVFKYPDDLPDLSSLRPPDGNTREGGIERSHYVRRQRGELPNYY